MDFMQKILDEQIAEYPIDAAIRIIEAKLLERGAELNRRQRAKLKDRLRSGAEDSLILGRSWPWKPQPIELSFTESDIAVLQHDIDAWLEDKLPLVIDKASDLGKEQLLEVLKRRWPTQSGRDHRLTEDFRRRLRDRWAKPFGLLEMFQTISAEFGGGLAERITGMPATHLHDAMGRLHARACQISAEVIVLMCAGFADGAMARWRSLHEVTVVMALLSDGGEELAERYRLHAAIESFKAAREYQLHATALGYEPIDESEYSEVQSEYESLLRRYGNPYRGSYGWAGGFMGLPVQPTLAQIEEAVSLTWQRPYYRMASYQVHANPKGAYFKLGLIGEMDLMLAGPSNYGFLEPGQSTAMSLQNANAAYAMSAINLDGIVLMKMGLDLGDEIVDALQAVQAKLEDDEARLSR